MSNPGYFLPAGLVRVWGTAPATPDNFRQVFPLGLVDAYRYITDGPLANLPDYVGLYVAPGTPVGPTDMDPYEAPPRRRARKGWDRLSQRQRRRYEAAGISQAAYESGVSLRAARGHRATPRTPENALRDPLRYQGYIQRNIDRLIGRYGEERVFDALSPFGPAYLYVVTPPPRRRSPSRFRGRR